MQARKIIVVGAGPIGAMVALKLREQDVDKKNLEIHVYDKRKIPGNRLEMLFILEDSFKKLPQEVQDYLLIPDKNGPKAFFSPKTYNMLMNPLAPIELPHVTVKIADLEYALNMLLEKTPGIVLHRGVEFIKNYKNEKLIAEFKDTETNIVEKTTYDEMIFSVGLSGSLDNPFLEAPRMLHSFPTVAAEYMKDNKSFDAIKNPTQVTYISDMGLIGVAITPDRMTIFTSVPPIFDTTQKSVQEAHIKKAIGAIPSPFKEILENIGEPTAIKSITATTTLSPQICNDNLHTHAIGDMVATFPYVYGSETNLAYAVFIPMLLNFLRNIESDPVNRPKLSQQYTQQVFNFIQSNENFLRILPFGETIALGQTCKDKAGNNVYEFPGYEVLSAAQPMTRKPHLQLLEIEQDAKPSLLGLFSPKSEKPGSIADCKSKYSIIME